MSPKSCLSEELVKEILTVALKALEPECIIVHGSYSRGMYIEGVSDVDLLIVSNGFSNMNIQERLGVLAWVFKGIRVTVEAVGLTPDEVMERMDDMDLYTLDAVFYGVPIYDDGFWRRAEERLERLRDEVGLERIEDGWRIRRECYRNTG
ncbi:MAG: nucleotidyltransferase domain-containing protein [Candidatus Bathyarchaeia archaeon]